MPGPIYFNVPEARERLLRHGSVVTVRHPRGEGVTHARHGNRKAFEVLGRVEVRLVVAHVGDAELRRFLEYSGFATVEAWKAAVSPGATDLYRVDLLARREAAP